MTTIRNIKAYLLIGTLGIVMVSCSNFFSSEKDKQGIYYDLEYPIITAPEQDGLPETILALYNVDASRMVVRMMHEMGGAAANEIELPADLTASLTNGLSAIYMASDIASRDSVVAIYPVHTLWLTPPVFDVAIRADSSRSFMQAWAAGDRFTGNSEIDSLMTRYDLHLLDYYQSSRGSPGVRLRSGRPLNMWALARRFSEVDEVLLTGIDSLIGDGSDITVILSEMSWIYTFHLRWGDCQAGCIAGHNWTFEANADGVVTFLGSTGTPLPGS